jgi:hypothetical protein
MLLVVKVIAIIGVVVLTWTYPVLGGLTLTIAYATALVVRKRK